MTDRRPIRVLIADDHALVRTGLKLFLSAFDDLELVGEAGSGEEAVRLCGCEGTDVVLMDLMMPGMGGVAATQVIREKCPHTRVIALTNFQEVETVQQALRAGATGYLLKNVSAGELAAAIRAAHSGRATLAPEATQALIDATLKPAPAADTNTFRLTSREGEVLALMARGLSNAQIAAQLVVSPMTVKFHVSNILSKLDCATRTEAVALALGRGLLDKPSKA
ncbi:MAG TPA: response regulator transcription factor [Anaerolineae bacterium]|nr:response regulator transcription factor [Anaerolineae bacterium]